MGRRQEGLERGWKQSEGSARNQHCTAAVPTLEGVERAAAEWVENSFYRELSSTTMDFLFVSSDKKSLQ